MRLHRIETMGELITFIPLLVQEKRVVKNLWEPVGEEAFVQRLINNFEQGAYFGEIRGGALVYFYAVLPSEELDQIWLWVVYHNKKFYSETRHLLKELITYFKALGYTSCLWASGILTSSYARWVEKMGAKLYTRTFKIDL